MAFVFKKVWQITKAIYSILIFIDACFVLLFVQLGYVTVYRRHPVRLQHGLDKTKKAFICLLITIFNVVAPSAVRITAENASIAKGTFTKDIRNGNRIISHLEQRSVMICNHQIYSDWVFLWWLTYSSNLSGRVYIMLKKSLRKIPLLGYGMHNFKFIFMNRKWAQDKVTMNNQLGELDVNARGIGPLAGRSPIRIDANNEIIWESTIPADNANIHWPYCLILFPEGTNLSGNTRHKSELYASKIGQDPMRNVLLPRSTGLRFALRTLKPSLDILYDVTIAYSGLKKEDYGELVYRLPNIFLKGCLPKLVDIHIRGFDIQDIPLDDEKEFTDWLFNVWREKDDLMERYYERGSFDLDPESVHSVTDTFKIETNEHLALLALPIMCALFPTLLIMYMVYR